MFMNLLCSTVFGFFACDALPPRDCYIEAESDLVVCLPPVEPNLPPVRR